MQCDNPTIEAVASEKIQKPHPLLTFAVFAAIFLATYLPCFLQSYGLLDDYYLLFLTLTKDAWCQEIVGSMMSQGRPLNLPFIAAAFSPLQGISDLVYLRIIATLGTAFLATLFFRHAMHVGWTRAQSFVLSLLVFSQLPFQVLSAWSLVGFLGAFRLPLAYVSYFLAKYAGEKPLRSPAFGGLYAATVIALTAAMAMHQATAMFFWIGLAQDVLSPKRWELSRRQLGVIFTTFGIACGIEYAICAWGKSAFAAYLLQDRDHLSFNVFEKLQWFFSEPITNCLNFNNLDASPLIAAGTAVTIFVGLWFFIKNLEHKESLKTRVLLLAGLPFLCYTPNLMVAESWSSYRTLYALAALMMIYFFCAIQGIAEKLKVGKNTITSTLLAAAVLNLIVANQNVATYIAEPQSREIALLRYRLNYEKSSAVIAHTMDQLTPPEGKSPFDIWQYDSKTIIPSWYETLAPAAYYDEFGRPSSARPFVAKAMVGLLQREAQIKRN
ncbi:MAG: hypothetical protein IT342_21030 [Candidatus Melainabacteria bacterium]|nr:hypothetical protein [Candidatus Melainabacteria bacterium]